MENIVTPDLIRGPAFRQNKRDPGSLAGVTDEMIVLRYSVTTFDATRRSAGT